MYKNNAMQSTFLDLILFVADTKTLQRHDFFPLSPDARLSRILLRCGRLVQLEFTFRLLGIRTGRVSVALKLLVPLLEELE